MSSRSNLEFQHPLTLQPAVLLRKLEENNPLVHTITNAVSINLCANVLLAIGARPVMAEAVEETAQISSGSDALVLNLGQLSQSKKSAMLEAGKAMNAHGGIIVLDPCGCGGSDFRRQFALEVIETLHPAVIRANHSELMALLHTDYVNVGVDAKEETSEDVYASSPLASNAGQSDLVSELEALARKTSAVIVCSGKTDYVTDGETTIKIENGTPMLSKVTGTGCALTTIVAAMGSVARDQLLEACAWAVMSMSICGELAKSRLQPGQGSGSFAVGLLDALSTLEPDTLQSLAKYKIVQTK